MSGNVINVVITIYWLEEVSLSDKFVGMLLYMVGTSYESSVELTALIESELQINEDKARGMINVVLDHIREGMVNSGLDESCLIYDYHSFRDKLIITFYNRGGI